MGTAKRSPEGRADLQVVGSGHMSQTDAPPRTPDARRPNEDDEPMTQATQRYHSEGLCDDAATPSKKHSEGVCDDAATRPPKKPRLDKSLTEEKNICCTIHGSITLEPLLVDVLDTAYCQRMRELRQLGTTYHVYPSANHTRFDHSLGVAHLAEKLCLHITRQTEWPTGVEPPSPRDCLCVKLAALVHDLGHGPFSHAFDGDLIPAAAERLAAEEAAKGAPPSKKLLALRGHKHELLSARLFEELLTVNGIKLSDYAASNGEALVHDEDLRFIQELLLGSKLEGGLTQRRGRGRLITGSKGGGGSKVACYSKDYLYDILSNEDSGLDVDKLDYFERDRKMAIGNAPDLSVVHLFNAAAVRMATFGSGECKVRRPVIAYRSKVMNEASHAFRLRYDLHEAIYTHKVVEGFQLLVTDLLLLLDTLGPVTRHPPVGGQAYRLSETVLVPAAFVGMTDSVLGRYKSLYLEGLGPATVDEHTAARCRALFRRYENREPYKLIFGRGLAGSEVSQKPKEIEAAVRRTIAHLGLPADCLDIRVGAMHYGKKESNPLISMRFFDKETDIDDDARAVDHGVLRFDVNVPEKFCLRSLRIYYKRGWKREADRPEYQKVKASLKTLLALVPPARPGESHTSPLAFSDKK